jgi:hypothetical protein
MMPSKMPSKEKCAGCGDWDDETNSCLQGNSEFCGE